MKLLRHELVGQKIVISAARNVALIGLCGKIIDETMQTITIKTASGRKRLIKKNITLDMTFQGKVMRVSGEKFVGRPEDRIKKVH